MKNRIKHIAGAMCILLMMVSPVLTASATAGRPPSSSEKEQAATTVAPTTDEPTVEASASITETETHEIELPINDSIITPDGNLSIVDDIRIIGGNDVIEILTVTTRSGQIFYLIVDRSGDTENVHFLNQVDESDLLALLNDEAKEEYESSKAEEESSQETEPVPVDSQPSGSDNTGILMGIIVILSVLLLGGCGVAAFFLLKKKDQGKKEENKQYDYLEDLLDEDMDEGTDYEEEVLDAADIDEESFEGGRKY